MKKLVKIWIIMYFSDVPQIEEISINKMITEYKNIKPPTAFVFVQNGDS